MYDFKNEFPVQYHDCFLKPELLKTYLQEPEFVHAVEKLLYNSQVYYFREEPDLVGEFLLEYRETFLRALSRFEYKKVSLEGYIGFTLKTYRKNFFKMRKIKQNKENKIYTNCDEQSIDKLFINTYVENSQMDLDLYVADTGYIGYHPKNIVSFDSLGCSDRSIYQNIICIVNEIIRYYQSRSCGILEYHKLILILIVCNQDDIDNDSLDSLLKIVNLNWTSYNILMDRREIILQDLRERRSEIERQLQHCYLNYLAEQREVKKRHNFTESGYPSENLSNERQKRLYRTLNNLRFRYLHMRQTLTFEQVSELTGLSAKELRKYYRCLKDFMHDQINGQGKVSSL